MRNRLPLFLAFILTAPSLHASLCKTALLFGLRLIGKHFSAKTPTIESSLPAQMSAHGKHEHLTSYEAVNAEIVRVLRMQIGTQKAKTAAENLEKTLVQIAAKVKEGDLTGAYAELRKMTSVEEAPILIEFSSSSHLYGGGLLVPDPQKQIAQMPGAHIDINVNDADVFLASVQLPTASIRYNNSNSDIFDPNLPSTPALKLYRMHSILAAFEELGHAQQLLNKAAYPDSHPKLLVLKDGERSLVEDNIKALDKKGELKTHPKQELEEADVYAYLLKTLGEENVDSYYSRDSTYPSRGVIDRLYRRRD